VTTEIKAILSDLRADHCNMSILLDLVEEQMLRVDAGKNPDLELLHDIMQYMTVYSDTIHHPKEDVVYREMKAMGGNLAEGLGGVETDHHEIGDLSNSLRDDIEAMLSGAAVTRERVMQDMIDYVHRLRKHMAWEESDLFLRADKLAEDSSINIDLAELNVPDPVFGATSEDAFRNLLTHLQLASER